MAKVIHIDSTSPNNQGSSYIGTFANYSAIVAAFPSANYGDLAIAENSQGTAWLPGSFGGNFYSKGTYIWDGASWSSNVDEIAKALNDMDLAMVLANGNFTNDGQIIKALNGTSFIDLRFNSKNNDITISNVGVELNLFNNNTARPVLNIDVGSFSTTPNYVNSVFNIDSVVMSLIKSDFTRFGGFTMKANDSADVNTASIANYPIFFAAQSGVIRQGVINTAIVGGVNIIAKTSNANYSNRFVLHGNNDLFETIIGHTSPSVDRTQTLQDRSGLIALVGQKIIVDASQSRPLQTTIALMNQQSGILETYLEGVITPLYSGNFEVGFSYIWSLNSASNNFLSQLIITDSLGATVLQKDFQIEPKDAGGTGIVVNTIQGGLIVGNANTGTDIRIPESYFLNVDLLDSETYTIRLKFGAVLVNQEATIYEGQLFIKENI